MEEAALKDKIDPDRYWSQADIGRKTELAVAAGLIAASQAWAGAAPGRNPVLDAIMGYVQMDISAQKAEMSNKASVRAGKQNLLRLLQQQVRDDQAAEQLAYKVLTADAADRVKGIGLRAGAPEVKAAAEVTAAQLQKKSLQYQNQAAVIMADKKTTSWRDVPLKGKGADEGGDKEDRVKRILGSIDRMKELFSGWKAGAHFAGLEFTSEAAEYKYLKNARGLDMWRLYDSGRLSDYDFMRAMTMYFKDARAIQMTLGRSGAMARFDIIKKDLQSRVKPPGTYKPKMSKQEAIKFAKKAGYDTKNW
jgi:hypothetical protein